VGFGLVTPRKPLDAGQRPRLCRVQGRRTGSGAAGGNEVAATLAAHDRLADREDAALLTAALRVAGFRRGPARGN